MQVDYSVIEKIRDNAKVTLDGVMIFLDEGNKRLDLTLYDETRYVIEILGLLEGDGYPFANVTHLDNIEVSEFYGTEPEACYLFESREQAYSKLGELIAQISSM